MLIIKPVEVKTILTICGMLAESSHNLTATRPSHTCCSSKTRAPSVTQRLSETGFFLFKTFYNEWKTIWHLWNVACLTLLFFFLRQQVTSLCLYDNMRCVGDIRDVFPCPLTVFMFGWFLLICLIRIAYEQNKKLVVWPLCKCV